jgi:hypothetical protein
MNLPDIIKFLQHIDEQGGQVREAQITRGTRDMHAGDKDYLPFVRGVVPDGSFTLSLIGFTTKDC